MFICEVDFVSFAYVYAAEFSLALSFYFFLLLLKGVVEIVPCKKKCCSLIA